MAGDEVDKVAPHRGQCPEDSGGSHQPLASQLEGDRCLALRWGLGEERGCSTTFPHLVTPLALVKKMTKAVLPQPRIHLQLSVSSFVLLKLCSSKRPLYLCDRARPLPARTWKPLSAK